MNVMHLSIVIPNTQYRINKGRLYGGYARFIYKFNPSSRAFDTRKYLGEYIEEYLSSGAFDTRKYLRIGR